MDSTIEKPALRRITSYNVCYTKLLRVATLIKEVDSLSHHAATAQFGVEDVSRGAKEISQNAEETSANAAKSEDGIDQVLQAMSDLTRITSYNVCYTKLLRQMLRPHRFVRS